MSLAISTSYASGELSDKLSSIKKAGFEVIEFSESDLVNFEGGIDELHKIITDYGLRVNALQKFSDLEGLEEKERKQAFTRLEKKLDLLKAIGGEILLLTSSTHPKSTSDTPQLAHDLYEAGEYAKKRGVRIAYIALPWAKNTQTEDAAVNLINQANHPNLGLSLNSLFTLGTGAKVAKLRHIPIEKIFHIQLADIAHTNFKPYYQPQNSLLPGQGELNLVGFVSVLARGKYKGDWTLSPLCETFINKPNVKDGYRSMVHLFDQVKRQEPGTHFPIPNLPEKSINTGFEFIEFASINGDKTTLTEILTTMGFRPERKHRTKEIILWRQGAINLLVNSHCEGHAHDCYSQHGTCVSNLGLRVEDAQQTVERAEGLGAEIIHEVVGSGEIAIPSIRGVGDHLVHFVDENSNLHQMWEINFTSLANQSTPLAPPLGIRRIDHVAQTMEYEQMQNWLLYYLSIFEMNKSSIIDVADPSGVIRSQTLATKEGEVRFNLNSSSSNLTMAGSFLQKKFGSGVQHIAFQTDDIFETSRKLEDQGFKRLSLPGNYYRDLETTFGIEPELLRALKNENIFYDRDGIGEYFQIFSIPIFKGFFFEIVERRNKYEGYGARNAPFRIKAQMKHTGVTHE